MQIANAKFFTIFNFNCSRNFLILHEILQFFMSIQIGNNNNYYNNNQMYIDIYNDTPETIKRNLKWSTIMYYLIILFSHSFMKFMKFSINSDITKWDEMKLLLLLS